MIRAIALFLPAFVCLFWFFIHLLLTFRTDTVRPVLLLLGSTTIFLFADCLYTNPSAPLDLVVYSILLSLIISPSILPLSCLYIHFIRTRSQLNQGMILLLILPVALFAIGITLYSLAGHQDICELFRQYESSGPSALAVYKGTLQYYFFVLYYVVLRVVLAFEMLAFLVYSLHVIRLHRMKLRHLLGFFKGRRVSVAGCQLLNISLLVVLFGIKMLYFRQFFLVHTSMLLLISLIQTLALFQFCWTALFSSETTVSQKQMLYAFCFNYGDSSKESVQNELLDNIISHASPATLTHAFETISEKLHTEEIKTGNSILSANSKTVNLIAAVSSDWTDNDLFIRFQHLLIEEREYLKPRLTLDDVALKLGSNKTYVSRMVNSAYNIGFPELINTLRVDYAGQYILRHPEAKQLEIAHKSGFLSASSFNTTFRKITGMTPKMWVASHQISANVVSE